MLFKHTFGVLITQSRFAHISELDSTLAATIHELIAMRRVKFGSCDDFCKFFHVDWLDIDNVERLVLYAEIPEVNTQIVSTDICFAIRIDTD